MLDFGGGGYSNAAFNNTIPFCSSKCEEVRVFLFKHLITLIFEEFQKDDFKTP